MLTSSEVAVVLPVHLHARPAGALVRIAAGFASTVELTHGDRTVNARGILAVLGLGATAGTTVVVRASGEDAEAAVAAVVAALTAAE
jgi:phosphotransferase system HPr (HPr) family protein